jgi:hypothetical protein
MYSLYRCWGLCGVLPLATHPEKQEYMKLEHKEHRGPSGVSSLDISRSMINNNNATNSTK